MGSPPKVTFVLLACSLVGRELSADDVTTSVDEFRTRGVQAIWVAAGHGRQYAELKKAAGFNLMVPQVFLLDKNRWPGDPPILPTPNADDEVMRVGRRPVAQAPSSGTS